MLISNLIGQFFAWLFSLTFFSRLPVQIRKILEWSIIAVIAVIAASYGIKITVPPVPDVVVIEIPADEEVFTGPVEGPRERRKITAGEARGRLIGRAAKAAGIAYAEAERAKGTPLTDREGIHLAGEVVKVKYAEILKQAKEKGVNFEDPHLAGGPLADFLDWLEAHPELVALLKTIILALIAAAA